MPPRRRVPLDPAAAQDAAKAAAAAKAERAPHRLSEREAMLLPGKTLLDLGNQGHLTHLGIGLEPTTQTTSSAPKGSTTKRGTGKTAGRTAASTPKARTGRRSK